MNKTMRKLAIALLAVMCFACLAFAVACGEKNRYVLTFICDDGVTVESEIKSGAEVQEGYEVSFTLVVAENAIGDPAVTVNDAVLNADANGVYTFKMKAENTVVEITGVSLLADYTVKFGAELELEDANGQAVTVLNQNNEWVKFSDLDGKPLTDLTVASGETVSFKLNISIYYDGYDYTVAAGSSVLRPDPNGVYTYSVTGNQQIAVKGLPSDEVLTADSFAGRKVTDSAGNEAWEGVGQPDNPFKIKKPFDLYYLARIISEDPSGTNGFLGAYYVLENDIDMRGEQLLIIGDKPDDDSYSVFGGTFDGQGHTIKNYYITDNYHDYVNDVDVHLSYVGLFGFVQPTSNGGAGIYNLNLENFTVTANGAASQSAVFVGGLVGYGIGATISNCSVNGTIIADGDNGYFGYAGGIIGFQQSAYSDENMRYYSVIQSCSSDVEISCDSGYIFAAGGIAGYQASVEERTAAAILNCYSTGNVIGAMRAGGITGYAGSYTSIKNCYATGNVIARSSIQQTAGDMEYHLAYAGGIAGYAQYGSILSNSFFTGTVNSRAAAGASFAFNDGIAGGVDGDRTEFIYTDGAVVYKCYSTAGTKYEKVTAVDDTFIQTRVGWALEDWSFKGDGKPVINKYSATKTFTVLVSVGGVTQTRLDVTDSYIPVSYWYYAAVAEEGNNKLPEFIQNGSLRTYGYYFDEDCKIKVPFGYIPTENLTLYAEFADYGEVAGTYYIAGGQGKHFELTDDGYILYRDGAVSCVSTYVYNGDYLILQNTFFAVMNGEEGNFYTFRADKTAGGLKIYSDDIYPESNPLTAVKNLENFNYGIYYGEGGKQYTFNEDGTGVWDGVIITYTVSGNTMTVLRDGRDYRTVTLTDGKFTALDGNDVTLNDLFEGEWEGSANTKVSYTFDGKGGWTNGAASGTYSYNPDGSITLDNGKTASYDNGFVTLDGEKLYRKNSFVGTWVYSAEQPVYVTLNGISAEGYGAAVINYSSGGVYDELNYAAYVSGGKTYVEIYNHYDLYALLCYNADNKTFNAEYLLVIGGLKSEEKSNVRLCLYDDFKGVWSGTDASGENSLTIEFNGYGNYNLSGTRDSAPQQGKITIGENDYKVVYLDENGELISSAVTGYTFEYDGEHLTVTHDGVTYTLTKNS